MLVVRQSHVRIGVEVDESTNSKQAREKAEPMALLYYDPIFLEHKTGDHPEHAERLLAVVRHLNFVGLDVHCERPAWDPVPLHRLLYVHSQEHIDSVRVFAEQGGGYIERDTVVSARSYEVALMAVGAVCDATVRVVQGDSRTALCLVRPPGHHAMPDHPMAFCLFNNLAVAARLAQRELGIERVLIVDFDVHHGNGTQATFWEDPSVGYFSMHCADYFPGTGGADEIGGGKGRGTTHNIAIRLGTSSKEQLTRFSHELPAFAEKLRPQLVLLSAGFDSHKEDPIGALGMETEDFSELTQKRHRGRQTVCRRTSGECPRGRLQPGRINRVRGVSSDAVDGRQLIGWLVCWRAVDPLCVTGTAVSLRPSRKRKLCSV